jgi:hypothetical protein
MPVVRGVTSAICHGKNYTGSDGPSQLNRLLDLLVSGPELLRTCEVGYRSRFAVEREDKSQMHQLLGLGVERACSMGFLEVVGVGLA